MHIQVDILPQKQMRYPTVGDYFEYDGILVFQIADMGNEVWNHMVLIHEMVEHLLAKAKGVSIAEIDAFDMAYTGDGEPGDEPNAPYRDQHGFATAVERMLCAALGISWQEYDGAIRALVAKEQSGG